MSHHGNPKERGEGRQEVGGFSGCVLRPLSDPGAAAGPVGSCSPKAAAARGAEDARRRRSPPLPNLLARGGELWGGAVASVIGRGRLQPPPKTPPLLAASDSSARRAKAAIERASERAAAAAPSTRSSGAAARPEENPPTDGPSQPRHPGGVGDGGVGGGLILPGLGHPSHTVPVSLGGAQ